MLKKNKPLRIGVDLMGHDTPPEVLLEALKQLSLPLHVEILAIGLPEYASLSSPLISYLAASQVIEMGDPPLKAVRLKKDSSLCVGLRLLKEHKIDLFLSAGNTGALIFAAKIILHMLPPFSRPALLTLMPTQKRPLAVLDVGANIKAKASHYVEFALMGASFQKKRGIEMPRVGLLNIGSESIKGTTELRLAYKQLEQNSSSFIFAGNIEGARAFEGDIDVLVTDGFTGNIFLKTSEGIASLFLEEMKTQIPPDVLLPYLNQLKSRMHYAEYPGAVIAGVQGKVMKCHGYSTAKSFASTIFRAIEEHALDCSGKSFCRPI